MRLGEAIEAIVESSRYDACKRPAMSGYFKRGAVSTETATAGDFTLTLVKRGGTQYALTYDADGALNAKWAWSGTSAPLTAELWEEMMADDWQVGTSADFEAARNPGANDEW